MRRRFLNNKLKCDKSSYFTIEALEDGLTVKLSQNASEYRVDNNNWMSLAADVETQSVNTGQKIQFRINEPTISSSYGIGTFNISKKCNILGNVMSLLHGDDFWNNSFNAKRYYVFYKLFYNVKNIIDASELILPATTLSTHCYRSMFEGCTSLTIAPKLPATSVKSYCYYSMFRGCTSLIEAPELPAITLASDCYSNMFNGCTKLNNITMLATDISAPFCLYNWVSGVSSSGTFTKNTLMITLPTSTSGIPSGWTVEDYNQNNFNHIYN